MATALEHLQSIATAAVALQPHAARLDESSMWDVRRADALLTDLLDFMTDD